MKSNPYVGPRPYEREDRHNFYGRDRETRELRALIVAEREVLFYAPSGAGKTSLLNAKVIPALEEKDFHVMPMARVGSELPPEVKLEAEDNIFVFNALMALAGEDAEHRKLLPHTLHSFLKEFPPEIEDDSKARPLVLIFDQFEELFTTHRDRWKDVRGFFEQVREALDEFPRLGVVFTMREDHVAAVDPYKPLFPRRLRAHFRMERLGSKGALAAVAEPALNAGCPFVAGVAERLVDDLRRVKVGESAGQRSGATVLGPYVEPVQLQVVCRRLWENLPEQSTIIQWKEVEQFGDIDRALIDFYEDALAQCVEETDVSERRLRDWFDEHLITPMETRGLAPRGKTETGGLPNEAVDILEQQHLIRADQRAGARWYELAHDRLIEPVQRSNANWREEHLSTLQRQAKLWEEKGRPSGLLLRDQALIDAEGWGAKHDDELTEVERSFLGRCQEAQKAAEREQRQTRRIRLWAIGATLFAILTVVAAIIAWGQRLAAQQAHHVVQSLALADYALEVEDQELAVLLGLEAVLQTHRDKPNAMTTKAINAVHQAMSRSRWRATLRGHSDSVGRAAWSPDGTRIVTTSWDGTAKVWDASTGIEIFTLSGHTDWVNHAAWSPDGTRIVTASSDDTAKVWNASTGEERFTLGEHKEGINHAAWSPGGALIVTASDDGSAKVWLASTGDFLLSFSRHVSGSVSHAMWSPDGDRIVTAESEGTASVWDSVTGITITTFSGHDGWIRNTAWSPDGKRIVTASDDGDAKVWDASTGEEFITLSGHAGPVLYAAWNLSGTHIATASSDGTGRVWGVDGGVVILQGHHDRVLHLAWSWDGTRIVTASDDGKAKVWDAFTGQELFTLNGHDGKVRHAAWSPDDAHIVTTSSDGKAKVWNASTHSEALTLREHKSWIVHSAWNPNGTSLATASSDETAKVWSASTGENFLTLRGHENGVGYAAWSWDKTRIVTADGDGIVKVWDASVGAELFTLSGHTDAVRHAVWSSDDTRILTVSDDGSAKVWNTSTGEELLTLSGHTDAVRYAAWNADDTRILTASEDGTAKVWDASNGEEIFTLKGHDDWIRHAAWSPDEKYILTASGDGSAKVWKVASKGELLFTLSGHDDAVRSATWSPDGARIATASWDETAKVWDASTGEKLFTFNGHTDRVYYAVWNPDGARILTASWDGTAKVWNAANGEELFTLRGHSGRIYHAVWSPDGTRVVTAGEDRSARIYFVNVEGPVSIIEFACSRTGRNMTYDEWKRYMGRDVSYRKTCTDLPIGE
jgi:WD40 repeat protein